MILLLSCPNCKNRMKYGSRSPPALIKSKRKLCVYCGKSFSVSSNIISREN